MRKYLFPLVLGTICLMFAVATGFMADVARATVPFDLRMTSWLIAACFGVVTVGSGAVCAEELEAITWRDRR